MNKGMWLLLSAVSVCTLAAIPVYAQTAPAPATAADAKPASDQVEEIVVTAQRREERLQDVPISISAVTAQQLGARGITDVRSLVVAVPGLTVPTQGSVTTPYIRGVGSNAADPNNEPSVATYVDGVYIAAPQANTFAFNNVERVEVLKGPQGTLFGRNATGGVIQIVTRTPTDTPTLEASAGYANYNDVSAAVYGSTGLARNVAIDVAAQYDNQMDGYGHNIYLNEPTGFGKQFSVRSKLLFTPDSATRITLAGDYSNLRNTFIQYHLRPGAIGIDGLPHYFGYQVYDTDFRNFVHTRQYGTSLRVEHDFDFATLISISAYRNAKGEYALDSDATPVRGTYAQLFQNNRQFTQELQLAARPGSHIKWLLGGFYYDSRAAYEPAVINGTSVAGPDLNLVFDSVQRTKSASAYGQFTAPIAPETNVTGGLRYTRERQSFNSAGNLTAVADGSLVAPLGTAVGHQGFNKFTWRLALDHELADRVRAYISYNRGIKSGGFDLLSLNDTGYKPESLDAYEVGIKSELFDRKLRLNAAAFYYDYRDLQVTSVLGGGTHTDNAAAARVKGVEFDFEAHPVTNLILSGGVSYLHSVYEDYPNPVTFGASAGTMPVLPLDAEGRPNAKGFYTTRAPKWTGNFGGTYKVPTAAGDFAANANLYYNGGYFFDPANVSRQSKYALLNSSLDWTAPGGQWGINIWVRNLTDKHYLDQVAVSAGGDLVNDAEPRRFGATARFKL